MDKERLVADAASKISNVMDRKIDALNSSQLVSFHSATVSRIGADGIIWAVISGSHDETPVEQSLAEVKPGDSVLAMIGDGKCRILGNMSRPSTDDTAANESLADANESISRVARSVSNAAAADVNRINAKYRKIADAHAKTMDQALDDIVKINKELVTTKETADGRNRVFVSAAEPTDEKPYTKGDLWYKTGSMSIPTEYDSEGNVTKTTSIDGVIGIDVWNGENWVEYTFVADKIIVPSSVGPTMIQNGAVQTQHMIAGTIDSSVIRTDNITATNGLFLSLEAVLADIAGTQFENGSAHTAGQDADGSGSGFYVDSVGNLFIGSSGSYLKYNASTRKISMVADELSLDNLSNSSSITVSGGGTYVNIDSSNGITFGIPTTSYSLAIGSFPRFKFETSTVLCDNTSDAPEIVDDDTDNGTDDDNTAVEFTYTQTSITSFSMDCAYATPAVPFSVNAKQITMRLSNTDSGIPTGNYLELPNGNGNVALGYPMYASASGNTNIYGQRVNINTKGYFHINGKPMVKVVTAKNKSFTVPANGSTSVTWKLRAGDGYRAVGIWRIGTGNSRVCVNGWDIDQNGNGGAAIEVWYGNLTNSSKTGEAKLQVAFVMSPTDARY